MHPSDIKIGQSERSVYDLFQMMEQGQILLDLEQDRWNTKDMSLSIESILLGLTMTPIYFDATNPYKWIVLDGKKRLFAIQEFLSGYLVLRGLEFFHEFDGARFEYLPKVLARKIHQTYFTIYSINQGVPPDVKLSLIRRIVPDLRKGLSWPLLESLQFEQTRELISLLKNHPLHKKVLDEAIKPYDTELIFDFLRTHLFFLEEDNPHRELQRNIEDVIIATNRIVHSDFKMNSPCMG
jgi:hypothetical protein